MPQAATTTDTHSAFACLGAIVWRCAPRVIGKHEWRIVVYRLHGSGRTLIGYEWRRAAQTIMGHTFPPDPIWRRDEEWPRYDSNDGQYGGMPRTLRRFHEAHRSTIAAHRAAS